MANIQDLIDELSQDNGSSLSTPVSPQAPPDPTANLAPIGRIQANVVAPQGPLPQGAAAGAQAGNDAGNDNGSGVSQAVQQAIGNKYGFGQGLDQQALQDAQAQANIGRLVSGLGQAGDTIARGVAGRFETPATEGFYKQQAENAQAPVQNIIQGRQGVAQNAAFAQSQEAEDPNSAVAKNLRDIYAPTMKRFGMDPTVLSEMSPNQIKSFMQQPLEYQARLASVEAGKQLMADSKSTAAGAKRDADQDKSLQSTQQLLESARGNPAAAQAEKDIYAAQKAKSLANIYGDPDKLSMPQVKLLASEIGKIASGGAPTMGELEGITPNTLIGRLSTVTSSLLNQPTPAHAAAFVKQYQDYANVLTKDAQKVIEDKYGRVIESRKGQLGVENYASLKTQYLDRFKNDNAGAGASSPAALSPEDQQAISWAKANPNDSRAQKILSLHGM